MGVSGRSASSRGRADQFGFQLSYSRRMATEERRALQCQFARVTCRREDFQGLTVKCAAHGFLPRTTRFASGLLVICWLGYDESGFRTSKIFFGYHEKLTSSIKFIGLDLNETLRVISDDVKYFRSSYNHPYINITGYIFWGNYWC